MKKKKTEVEQLRDDLYKYNSLITHYHEMGLSEQRYKVIVSMSIKTQAKINEITKGELDKAHNVKTRAVSKKKVRATKKVVRIKTPRK
jgi:hypothetical protein